MRTVLFSSLFLIASLTVGCTSEAELATENQNAVEAAKTVPARADGLRCSSCEDKAPPKSTQADGVHCDTCGGGIVKSDGIHCDTCGGDIVKSDGIHCDTCGGDGLVKKDATREEEFDAKLAAYDAEERAGRGEAEPENHGCPGGCAERIPSRHQ